MILDHQDHPMWQLYESQQTWKTHRQARVREYEKMLRCAEQESDGLKREFAETQAKLKAMDENDVWVSAEEHNIITYGRDLILERLMRKQEHVRRLKAKIDEEASEILKHVYDMQQIGKALAMLCDQQQQQQQHILLHHHFRSEPFTVMMIPTHHCGALPVMRWQEYLKHIMHLRSCKKQTFSSVKFPYRHKKNNKLVE